MPRANWFDLIAIIIFLRVLYISSALGVGKQILPFFSLLVRLYISLYCYEIVGLFFVERTSIPTSLSRFLAFGLILLFLYFVSRLLTKMIKVKKPERLIPAERFFGVVLGALKSLTVLGLTWVMICLAPVEDLDQFVKNSVSGISILKMNISPYIKLVKTVSPERYADKMSVDTLIDDICEKSGDGTLWKVPFIKFNVRDRSRYYNEKY